MIRLNTIPAAPSASFTATRNACKLCAPLGACLAFRGIEGAVPFLHGSQGCSTYIRRYMISHFKEPVDIASSNFCEETTVFGGRENLRTGLENVIRQYAPKVIGIATTCLAETIGEDVAFHLREIRAAADRPLPELVHVSTPSYAGTHAEGFAAAVKAIAATFAQAGPRHDGINLLPGMVSPADIRYLKEICRDFGLSPTVLPDYSDTLDGPTWSEYHRIPSGGTPLESLRSMGGARASVEFVSTFDPAKTAAALLCDRFNVPRHGLPLPIGVVQTDRFFEVLETFSGRPTPAAHEEERGRLIDSYVDAHKYVFGKRAVVYGEQDLVVSMAAFLAEIGIVPVLCGSGGRTGRMHDAIAALEPEIRREVTCVEGVDFAEIEERAAALKPDIIIGHSKGFALSRKLGVPLLRIGFPVHDRIDGPRLLHVGYRGAQQLFDRIANTFIESAQESSEVGYSYM